MSLSLQRQLREKQRTKRGGEGVRRQLPDGAGGHEEERRDCDVV